MPVSTESRTGDLSETLKAINHSLSSQLIIIERFHGQLSYLPTRFQNWRLKCIYENNGHVFYEDGELCDIPKHCRLDVRVQMPKDSVWNIKRRKLHEKIEGIREK
ncbi:phage tail fiber protein [Photorhabdus sp. CRCIA-P01]|uniref:phage tail fiber protein n=1 Tax=Photorhabdus sp. CRCIA-P01 TaxID=2019570 RepID=UPI001E4E67F1|nr:hypothetical protein [Photorhabdus sp. CRCIA-P01]